jgi:hypothetical protein
MANGAMFATVLCILVLDLNPSNAEFGLQLVDFSWNPSFLVELSRILIPLVSVDFRIQILRYSIS